MCHDKCNIKQISNWSSYYCKNVKKNVLFFMLLIYSTYELKPFKKTNFIIINMFCKIKNIIFNVWYNKKFRKFE